MGKAEIIQSIKQSIIEANTAKKIARLTNNAFILNDPRKQQDIDPLLPLEVKSNEKKEMSDQELKSMQEQADKLGILLPTWANRSLQPATKSSDDEGILLPIEMNG